MKLLNTPKAMYGAYGQLIRKFQYVSLAVAWAECGFPAYQQLIANRKKIKQAIIGTHFYQTHPDFVGSFINDKRVRFVRNTDGGFHPKIYLFENSSTDWACIVGSANFTGAAFNGNDEANVLFGPAEDRDGSMRRRIDQSFSDYWDAAEHFTLADHLAYEIAAHARGQPSRASEAQNLRQETMALASEMDRPLNQALDLARVLNLIGTGMPRTEEEYGALILEIGDMITRELDAIKETWQKVLVVNKPPDRNPHRRLNSWLRITERAKREDQR